MLGGDVVNLAFYYRVAFGHVLVAPIRANTKSVSKNLNISS
jgi:hypothetical protein